MMPTALGAWPRAVPMLAPAASAGHSWLHLATSSSECERVAVSSRWRCCTCRDDAQLGSLCVATCHSWGARPSIGSSIDSIRADACPCTSRACGARAQRSGGMSGVCIARGVELCAVRVAVSRAEDSSAISLAHVRISSAAV